MINFITKISPVVIIFLPLSAATIRQWDPQPYFSEEDSPFINGIRSGDIYLEDFEDQELNTPFVESSSNLGFIGGAFRTFDPNAPFGRVWSVDGDDGIVDGIGFSGESWIGINGASSNISRRMQFDFQPDDQGRYPSYVGIVVTGFDNANEEVSMAVWDTDGIPLPFSDAEFDPREWIPEGVVEGGDPRLHRFIGFYNEGGISSFAMDQISQLDHLQYGYAIPEPSTVFLGMLAFPLIWQRRHKIARSSAVR